jgi:uncharacterized protein (TIGR00730 family)
MIPSAGIGGFGIQLIFAMLRLCIFCGSNTGNNQRFKDSASELARAVVHAGYGVVYGGGRVGLMGIAADAALAAGGDVIGVIPRVLATAEVAHDGVSTLHVVESMHERKALMADLSDAFVALPGGFGTMDEFHEIVTWRQLRIHDKPIFLFNEDGYYDALIALYERMAGEGFLAPRNRGLFTVVRSIDELIAALPR